MTRRQKQATVIALRVLLVCAALATVYAAQRSLLVQGPVLRAAIHSFFGVPL